MNWQISHQMLRLARESVGTTQAGLSEATGIAQGTISKYEKGLASPSRGQVETLGGALGFPVAFFEQLEARPATVLYRSKALRSARLETHVRARLNLVRLVVTHLLEEITTEHVTRFPDPDQVYDSPEAAAHALRRAWGVVPGPVESVSNLLERAGGVVVRADLGTDLVAAAYLHPIGDPVRWFVINTQMTAGDRVRFSLAHELGHAVLHETALLPDSAEAERESHRFSAAFLVPQDDLLAELPRGRLQIADLMVLKMRFGVSMQTILLAAHRAGSISQSERDRLFRVFSSRGWRLNEPGDVPVEQPMILREALRIHREEHGYADGELATAACVTLDTLSGLLPEYFERPRPTLRVVSRTISSYVRPVDAKPADSA